eukprot:g2111.t1
MFTPNIDALAMSEGFELRRMYAYRFCSPTRSALMSGRTPYRVNQKNNAQWGWPNASVHPRMKLLPQKLQEAGYYTVHAGKWHLGLAKQSFTPTGRGFNESLAMLMGSEDHLKQRNGNGLPPGKGAANHVDLWHNDRPARAFNGTYSAHLFGGYAEQALRRHAADPRRGPRAPFFMYLAYTVTHSPEQAPARYTARYPGGWVEGRRQYAGMASALDESVGNVTRALKELGMWNNTLLVLSARGRALPAVGSHFHVADTYATFCGLARHPDCVDRPGGGVPASDSHDMWPVISGETDVSSRNETVLSFIETAGDAALLQGRYKYIVGRQSGTGWWWGPAYPNSTTKLPMTAPGCPGGCLFDVEADPGEHVDLSAQLPALKAALAARLARLGAGAFQSDANATSDPQAAAAKAEVLDWWQPWLV